MSNENQINSSHQRWSPMTCLPSLTLTQSGLLELDHADGEVELLSRSLIELRVLSDPLPILHPINNIKDKSASGAEWVDRDLDLKCTLTTHRLVFQSLSLSSMPQPVTRFLHLSTVMNAIPDGGGWTTNRSYKINFKTQVYGSLVVLFRSYNDKNDRDSMHAALTKALERKAWEETARLEEKRTKSVAVNGITKRRVGVDAIVTKNKLKHKEAARVADQAFGAVPSDNGSYGKPVGNGKSAGDVDTLMKEASELVGIIKRYVLLLEQQQEKNKLNSDQSQKEDEDEDAWKLTSMLEDMGMTMALSKKEATGSSSSKKSLFKTKNKKLSATESYHQRLARQLCDFLQYKDRLKNDAGGMMTCTDVYCLFNRARGTNLVSPEDLMAALGEMEGLGLGDKIAFREFPSGVKVVQEGGYDDDVMAKKLVELITTMEDSKDGTADSASNNKFVGITALKASKSLKVSALLANELLLSAERMGYLCRDVTLEGTRFYKNCFDDWDSLR